MPDTIKTTQRVRPNLKHAQTPHVNAGGWIDTPAPLAQSQRLDTVAEDTQEIPAELMQGIAKEKPSEIVRVEAQHTKQKPAATQPAIVPPSLAKEILKKQQAKSEEAVDDNGVEDTLNMGDATRQSMQNMLEMNDTQLIQQHGSDTQVLSGIITNVEHLQGVLGNAGKNISQLQTEFVSTGPIVIHAEPSQFTKTRRKFTSKFVQTSSTQQLRPTRLSWVIISVLIWYLVECVFAEIYSHPLYAEKYEWPSEPEPDFPFVLPTMISRWSQLDHIYPVVTNPLRIFFMTLIKTTGMWLGGIDSSAPQATTSMDFTDAVSAASSMASVGLDVDEYL